MTVTSGTVRQDLGFQTAGRGVVGDRRPLLPAVFQPQLAIVGQESRGISDQLADQGEAVVGGVERLRRLIGELRIALATLGLGDVRQIGHHQVPAAGKPAGQVTLMEAHCQLQPYRIALGDGEGLGAGIGGLDGPARQLLRTAQRQGARSGPDIQQAARSSRAGDRQDLLSQLLGLRPRHQDARSDRQLQAAERLGPQHIRQGLTPAAALDTFAQPGGLGVIQGHVMAGVDVESAQAEGAGEDPLALATGIGDALAGEIGRPALHQIQERARHGT